MRKKSKKYFNVLRKKQKVGQKMDSKSVAFLGAGKNLFSYADFSNSIFTEKKKIEDITNEKRQEGKRGYRKTYKGIK